MCSLIRCPILSTKLTLSFAFHNEQHFLLFSSRCRQVHGQNSYLYKFFPCFHVAQIQPMTLLALHRYIATGLTMLFPLPPRPYRKLPSLLIGLIFSFSQPSPLSSVRSSAPVARLAIFLDLHFGIWPQNLQYLQQALLR